MFNHVFFSSGYHTWGTLVDVFVLAIDFVGFSSQTTVDILFVYARSSLCFQFQPTRRGCLYVRFLLKSMIYPVETIRSGDPQRSTVT